MKWLIIMYLKITIKNTKGDQKVLQFDTLSNKSIFFIVDWTNTVLHSVMYIDKMIASFVVMTSSWHNCMYWKV